MMGVFVSMSSVGGQWRRSTALFAHHSPDSQNEKHWGCSAVASFSRTLRVQGDVLGDIVMIKLGGFIERAAPKLVWYHGRMLFEMGFHLLGKLRGLQAVPFKRVDLQGRPPYLCLWSTLFTHTSWMVCNYEWSPERAPVYRLLKGGTYGFACYARLRRCLIHGTLSCPGTSAQRSSTFFGSYIVMASCCSLWASR